MLCCRFAIRLRRRFTILPSQCTTDHEPRRLSEHPGLQLSGPVTELGAAISLLGVRRRRQRPGRSGGASRRAAPYCSRGGREGTIGGGGGQGVWWVQRPESLQQE